MGYRYNLNELIAVYQENPLGKRDLIADVLMSNHTVEKEEAYQYADKLIDFCEQLHNRLLSISPFYVSKEQIPGFLRYVWKESNDIDRCELLKILFYLGRMCFYPGIEELCDTLNVLKFNPHGLAREYEDAIFRNAADAEIKFLADNELKRRDDDNMRRIEEQILTACLIKPIISNPGQLPEQIDRIITEQAYIAYICIQTGMVTGSNANETSLKQERQ